ncbi:hypothetical protein BJX96DRAFT_171436 [Aspergillus floccosus]
MESFRCELSNNGSVQGVYSIPPPSSSPVKYRPLIVGLHGGCYDHQYFDATPTFSASVASTAFGVPFVSIDRPSYGGTSSILPIPEGSDFPHETGVWLHRYILSKLWTEFGVPHQCNCIVLLCHSLGVMGGIIAAALHAQDEAPLYPLGGLIASGMGDRQAPSASRPPSSGSTDNGYSTFPVGAKDVVMFKPGTVATEVLVQSERLNAPAPRAETVMFPAVWLPVWKEKWAAHVSAPVMFSLVDDDPFFVVNEEELGTCLKAFKKSVRVDGSLIKDPPSAESPYEHFNDQIGLAPDLQTNVNTWDVDLFSFDNVVPSYFFDTDISLCDLLQQFPASDQSLPQRGVGDAVNLGQTLPGLSEEDRNVQIPPLPPRFPSTEDQVHTSNLDAGSESAKCPWTLSAAGYRQLSQKVVQCQSSLPGFNLPPKFALMRYLEGYFRGFHDHFPFLHTATFDPQNVELELLIAIAAVGALYRFEQAASHQLYTAARNLVERSFHKRRQRDMASIAMKPTISPQRSRALNSSPDAARSTPGRLQVEQDLRTGPNTDLNICFQRAQALIILIAMSAWSKRALVYDSLAMGSQLAVLVRELGINRPDDMTDMELSWDAWITHQQRRRTLLVAYILFNLHSITFNVPPLILNHEVALCLPSCEAEWKANSQAAWASHRQISGLRELTFNASLNILLEGRMISESGAISAFSNYLLIHGIVQKIYLEHQTSTCHSRDKCDLRLPFIKSMETTLRSWQASWEATYESTLDPCSPKGPLGFNATALLRMAYIRLHVNLGLCHDLVFGDPSRIQELFRDPSTMRLSRSPSLDRAILQCIHALSIPVRVGIPYVAQTQTAHWSIQHSICNLECAFLLIQETHFQSTLDYEDDHSTRITRLAVSTSRMWAEVTGGIHVFDIAHRVGVALSVAADVLESQLLETAER